MAAWIRFTPSRVIVVIAHFLLVSAGSCLGCWEWPGSQPPNWLSTASSWRGAGWIAGRLGTGRKVLIFAATLVPWDFADSLSLNVPGLARLAANAFHDSRYLDSLVTALATHALLFGSLFAGAWWSFPQARPPSITEPEVP